MSIKFYEQNAASFIAQTADVDMTSLYDRFCEHLPSGASVLDAGCGSGRDALAFSEMGFNVVAFDASQMMVEAARKLAGVPVHEMTFEDLQLDQKFDGIWACASLLHVPRARLSVVLARLSSFLAPAGILYASFKYGDMERQKGGRYFNDLNEHLLKGTLEAVPNLKMIDVWTTTDQRSDRGDEQWLNCLLCGSQQQ